MSFSNKVAIVTGAGQGIGLATAALFASRGASVVIAEINPDAGHHALSLLKKDSKAIFIQTNVADEDSVKAMVQQTVKTFGRIDFLVNNAAISSPGMPVDLAKDKWDRVLAVNLTGPFLAAKHAAPHLAAQHGAIVNISSTRAIMSEPHTEAYSASKAGLLGLTHALAMSLGPSVRVNAICPGWIDTVDFRSSPRPADYKLSVADHAQHPAGRVGTPDDIAEMVLYLCSPAASFITGQHFIIDGGMTKKMIYV